MNTLNILFRAGIECARSQPVCRNHWIRNGLFAALLMILFSPLCASAFQDARWTRFRGPNGTGIAADARIPLQWSEEDYEHRIPLRGRSGSSSPVIFNDLLFVTSADPETAEVYLECFDIATGEQKWDFAVASDPYRMHGQNSYAASTPAVDGKHVYFMVANPQRVLMIACDHVGQEVWRRDFGTWSAAHGFSMSPVIYKELVLFCNSQQALQIRDDRQPGQSVFYAVSRETGETVWERPLTATRACYSTPCLLHSDEEESGDGNQAAILCSNTGDGIYSLNPETGEMNWSTGGIRMRTVAVTLVAGDIVFASNGSGGGGNYLVAMRLEEDEPPELLYELRESANYVPSPIVFEDLLYTFSDRGIVSCYEVETGENVWRERVSTGFSGSPVVASGHLFVMTPDGQAMVFKTGREYQLVHQIALGEESRATPAVAGNRVFLRTSSQILTLKGE